MYQVQYNGTPASITGSFIWHNADYKTFEDALVYAKDYMGEFAGTIPDSWDGSAYDYTGYGDTIAIVEIK